MSTAVANNNRLGRFNLLRELGRGAQGTVYLAEDPHLQRQVALKTLRGGSADELEGLLDEARAVSRLQHPNIVTLFDAEQDKKNPFLVFEYVAGTPLSVCIKNERRIAPARACGIAVGIARGLAFAHAEQVVHRDIKPANVLINAAGVPRLMDFGIARRGASGPEAGYRGTPAYMAPEYIDTRNFTPACDVYAVGVVLYEMLTGQPPFTSASPFEAFFKIVNESAKPPSSVNAEVDARLDAIVLKALAKKPDERYDSATSLADDLSRYLEPDQQDADGGGSATVEFLLRRLRLKSDFPALGGTLSSINRIVGTETEHTSVLSNAILKDVSMSNRLLKIVNAVAYRQFGGSISTISRAVDILGFNTVRNLALSLTLMDHLHDRTQANAMQEEVVACYVSGLAARELSAKFGVRDPEQAFVCAMFRRLGRLLVLYFLHEEAVAIEKLVAGRGFDEARAAREVLGIGFEELGSAIAKAWNFPGAIIDAMQPTGDRPTSMPASIDQRTRLLAEVSNDLANIARLPNESDRSTRLAAMAHRYARIGLNTELLTATMDGALTSLLRDADALGIAKSKGALISTAKAVTSAKSKPPKTPSDSAAGDPRLQSAEGANAENASPPPGADSRPQDPSERHAQLNAGIQEITNTLATNFNVNEVLRIILETFFRSMSFTRVLLFVVDGTRQSMRCRIGFGQDAETFVKQAFMIPLDGARTVFHAAAGLGNDLSIEDIEADKIRPYIPEWYRKRMTARGMLLLPITVGTKRIGMIYADVDDPAKLRFVPQELSLLKTLRNQAVLAVRQSS
ncbi:MAG: protein kinase domain-containing protein [Burkholderiales bacterium]